MITRVNDSNRPGFNHVITKVLIRSFLTTRRQGKHEFKLKMLSHQTRHMTAICKLIHSNYSPDFPPKIKYLKN